MKKILTGTLVLCLTLMVTGATLAETAPKPPVNALTNEIELTNPFQLKTLQIGRFGNAYQFEGWYNIKKETPAITAQGSLNSNVNQYDFKYFKNDQTFANFIYNDNKTSANNSATYFNGSYLFANNFFTGLEYLTRDDKTVSTLTPGYRFDLGNSGYVAASFSYATRADSIFKGKLFYQECGVANYEIQARYYTANSRVYGQVVIPNEDVVAIDETYFNVGGAYQLFNNLVVGGRYYKMDNYCSSLEIGCTANFDKLGAEFRYIKYNADSNVNNGNDYNKFDVNLLYSFDSKIRAGFEAIKTEHIDNPDVIAKVKYEVDNKKSYVFMHRLANHDQNIANTYLFLDLKL